MSRLIVFTHPACLDHDPGEGHPESPARLRAVRERMAAISDISVQEAAALVELAPLLAVHPREHLDRLERFVETGGGTIFLDTALNYASWAAVLGGTGAILEAVHHAHNSGLHSFAAVRPPGHHALANTPMGFCLVNNVVVAAREAQRLGRARVLIIDWDVHHGNGTQALVERDASIRFVSMHQHPWYPGTGMSDERGVGNVFNVPRAPGMPAATYVADLWAAIRAATDDWTPDLVLISAGFDAMLGDPLGGFTLEPAHYADLTTRLRELLPSAPIVGLLEGGYAPARLADGVVAHLGALYS